MKNRKNLPVAALRAFEAAARNGRISSAAEELGVTHGAVSRHVGHLEDLVGVELFTGPRNRPVLTPEGKVFGDALTVAFDQIEDAFRIIGQRDDGILDVACLSTFAMRWLIPRLHEFTSEYPQYDVRIATDERALNDRVDAQILVTGNNENVPADFTLLFAERLALVVSPQLQASGTELFDLPRLKTKTRPDIWREWSSLSGISELGEEKTARVFDHYHMTIEAALNSLGAAITPWHLVENEVACGRLLAPLGAVESGNAYFVRTVNSRRMKTQHFVKWLVSMAKAG